MPESGKVVIDLFCGAGGLSLGAHFAGFKTALAVDNDAKLTSSFSENFPGAKLLLEDLSQLSGCFLLDQAGLKANEVSGIIGGPPCQGFSLIGQRDATNPRNAAISHFFRLVREIMPAFFLMENVPGILLGDASKVLGDLIASVRGYEILGPIRVNASDFGALRTSGLARYGADADHVQWRGGRVICIPALRRRSDHFRHGRRRESLCHA
jgi:DNA (cytosine-5)-methyltransferase 1